MSALTNGNRDLGTDAEMKLDRIDTLLRSCDLTVGEADTAKAGRRERLRRTIESEIIPRLMLTCGHSAPSPVERKSGARGVRQDDVVEFTERLLDYDAAKAAEFVEVLVCSGVPRHAIVLDLFAPSARRLGEMWETDTRNFAEVTLAMGALQQTLRRFNVDDEAWALAHTRPQARTIFLTPCTGEQHSFSVQVLDVFFSNAGWQVETRLSYNGRDIEAVIKKRHLDIVGLSVSRESLLEQIASDIESIRCKSCNPNLIVLVGGGFFAEHPELVSRVGADATASDARSAVALADRLVPERATVKR